MDLCSIYLLSYEGSSMRVVTAFRHAATVFAEELMLLMMEQKYE